MQIIINRKRVIYFKYLQTSPTLPFSVPSGCSLPNSPSFGNSMFQEKFNFSEIIVTIFAEIPLGVPRKIQKNIEINQKDKIMDIFVKFWNQFY